MNVTEPYIIKGVVAVLVLNKKIQELEDEKSKISDRISSLVNDLIEVKNTLKIDMKDENQIIVQLNNCPNVLHKITQNHVSVEIERIFINIKQK